MSKIWPLPHVGTLTGTMRIPIDKTNGGTANDTAHFTPDDVVAYVEDNADVGGTPDAHAASHATGSTDPITPASIGAATVAEAGAALTAAQGAQSTADGAASAATAAQGTADNAVTAAGTAQTTANAAGMAADTAQDAADAAASAASAAASAASAASSAASAAQTTADAALPKPGGTTTANGIAYGTGTSGAAVAISTTTIADLQKRLGNVFTLNADAVLDDSYSGAIIFVDTSGGARTLTIPPTVSAGFNCIIVREGANALNIVGSTVGADTMLMAGPAAAANAVAIAVDDGGVSVIRRSATKCWCAGKIS